MKNYSSGVKQRQAVFASYIFLKGPWFNSELMQHLCGVSHVLAVFVWISFWFLPKRSGRWISDSQLPQGVNECDLMPGVPGTGSGFTTTLIRINRFLKMNK